jgi:pimeloyl-ACP methyl ester carboxylesterase
MNLRRWCGVGRTGGTGVTTVDGRVEIGGGRSLFVSCAGEGEPTVILESGYHDSSSLWSQVEPILPSTGPSVQERLSRHGRVCSYDRPGTLVYGGEVTLTTRSTPVLEMPRPANAAVADLHALIAATGLPTPVILVAHSFGGLLARLYAQRHPGEVAGVVFVDAFAVEMRAAMGSDWARYRRLLDRPGTAFDNTAGFERFDVDAAIDEALAGGPMPDIPMVVLTKTEPFALPAGSEDLGAVLERAWVDATAGLVSLGRDTAHVSATGSDHYIHLRRPDLVAAATLQVIERTGG